MNFPTTYELQYPIQKVPGSQWIVVGVTVAADRTHVHSLDIHFDADDQTFHFADAADWPELDAKLVEQFNAPHRKSARLARRRMTEFVPDFEIMADNAERSAAYMEMTRARRLNPCIPVNATVGRWTVGFVPIQPDSEQK